MLHPQTVDAYTRAARPGLAALLERGRRPSLPEGHPYALLAGPSRHEKMRAFPTLSGLCHHIDRERGGHGLVLNEATLHLAGQAEACPCVAVTIIDTETGSTIRFLGYACLQGGGVRALKAALHEYAPERTERAEWH